MTYGKAFEELTKRFEGLSPTDRINEILAIGEPGDKRITSRFIEGPVGKVKLKVITVTSPTTVKATYTFTVEQFYCNGSGNLHGGAQSTFYDLCTSLTLMGIGKRGFWINGGVSRVLTVTYLRPAPEGTELEMETEVLAAGKTLAMLRGVIKRASDGAPISTCEHNKAAVASKPNWKL